MQQAIEKGKVTTRVICGFIAADQRRILQLESQGLRPAAIAAALRLRPGGALLVRQFLELHGIQIPDAPVRALAS